MPTAFVAPHPVHGRTYWYLHHRGDPKGKLRQTCFGRLPRVPKRLLEQLGRPVRNEWSWINRLPPAVRDQAMRDLVDLRPGRHAPRGSRNAILRARYAHFISEETHGQRPRQPNRES